LTLAFQENSPKVFYWKYHKTIIYDAHFIVCFAVILGLPENIQARIGTISVINYLYML